jgi:hypothetical protein
MGATGRSECVGRGDGSGCPYGAVPTVGTGGECRCDDCRHHWELDETEPDRRLGEDEAPTRPLGDPGEAGHGTAA